MSLDISGKVNVPFIVKFLNNNIKNIWAIYLFGSAAQAVSSEYRFYNKSSDIDLAVLLSNDDSNSMDAYRLWNIAQDLSVKLDRDIDLINLRIASTVMQKQVIDGVRIFSDKSHLRDINFLENFIDSQYVRLNESRMLVIEDAIERGSIYDK